MDEGVHSIRTKNRELLMRLAKEKESISIVKDGSGFRVTWTEVVNEPVAMTEDPEMDIN